MWNQILLEDLLHDISHFSRNCSPSTYNLLSVPSLLLRFLLYLLLLLSKVLIFSLSEYTLPIQFSILSITRRRQWQPTPVFLPGESQGQGSLMGCHLWDRTKSDTTEAIQQQQQQTCLMLGFCHSVGCVIGFLTEEISSYVFVRTHLSISQKSISY